MSTTPRTTATHSIRCSDRVWATASARARKEGVSMNHVIVEIMEGYATGQVNLPRTVKVFDQPAPTAPEDAPTALSAR